MILEVREQQDDYGGSLGAVIQLGADSGPMPYYPTDRFFLPPTGHVFVRADALAQANVGVAAEDGVTRHDGLWVDLRALCRRRGDGWELTVYEVRREIKLRVPAQYLRERRP